MRRAGPGSTQRAAAAAMAVAAVLLVAPAPAAADDVADFYRGKSATLYLGYPPGGAYDIYARLIARYLTRHMPGNPNFIVRHKPGAASLNLVNQLFHVAPHDGSAIGMFARSVALNRLLGREGTNFDPVAFNWIGSANNEVSVCAVWHGVGVRSIEDFLSRPLVFAANAPGAESDVYPNILNHLVGTKFRVVAGYPGVNDLTLALERGEADARCGWSWGSLKAAKPDWIRARKIYIAVQFANAKHPELPDVPLATDLARTARERAALELILTQQVMGRPLAAPPNVPAERVAALRRAFMAVMRDPDFLAEADKAQLEIAPVDGASLQAMVASMFASSAEVVEAARAAIGQR